MKTKWMATPHFRILIGLIFITQFLPFGSQGMAFSSCEFMLSKSGHNPHSQPMDDFPQIISEGYVLAQSERWESLGRGEGRGTQPPAGTTPRGSQDPLGGTQGDWKPIGGRPAPPAAPPIPSKPIQEDEKPIQGPPPKSTSSDGTGPVVLEKDQLSLAFAPGSRALDRLQIARVNAMPPIQGTKEEISAWQEVRIVGDAWQILDPTGTAESYLIKLRFDPSYARQNDLILSAVSNGRLWLPRVFAADLNEGYVIAEGHHFSTFGIVAAAASIGVLIGVVYKAHSFLANEKSPWVLIEPGHERIKDFIKENKLALPSIHPDTERVELANYKKVFEERENTAFNRVVHLTGKRGSQVLDETKVACWDLTTLFASILYTLDPDIHPRMRMVKGTMDGGRHSWIEVVINGQVFVVNTGVLDKFELVARDVLYKEQKLSPSQFYTKDSDSLGKYDPEWFKPYLGEKGKTQAKIDALKARHKELQVELESLGAKGTSITSVDEARMEAIRTEQKRIYHEVLNLQKTLSQ